MLKFKADARDVAQALKHMVRVVPRHGFLEVLQLTLIDVQQDKVVMTGTDHDRYLKATIASAEVEEEGRILVSPRELLNIASLGKEGDIIELTQWEDDTTLQVSLNKHKLQLETVDAEEYIDIPEFTGNYAQWKVDSNFFAEFIHLEKGVVPYQRYVPSSEGYAVEIANEEMTLFSLSNTGVCQYKCRVQPDGMYTTTDKKHWFVPRETINIIASWDTEFMLIPSVKLIDENESEMLRFSNGMIELFSPLLSSQDKLTGMLDGIFERETNASIITHPSEWQEAIKACESVGYNAPKERFVLAIDTSDGEVTLASRNTISNAHVSTVIEDENIEIEGDAVIFVDFTRFASIMRNVPKDNTLSMFFRQSDKKDMKGALTTMSVHGDAEVGEDYSYLVTLRRED